MRKYLNTLIFALATFIIIPHAMAIDINLLNVNVGAPQNPLTSLYGKAFGFTPQQVAPALLGPAAEVPAVLQIAQAAGTVPMTVWMMRRMGMSYTNILSTFALAPTALMGAPTGAYNPTPFIPSAPLWGGVTNPFLVEVARTYFLRDVLRAPYHPGYGYWLPPGQAKKLGLWMPPGQAKKIGWGPWGPGKWEGKEEGKEHGHGHGHRKFISREDNDDHGDHGGGNHGHSGGHGHGK